MLHDAQSLPQDIESKLSKNAHEANDTVSQLGEQFYPLLEKYIRKLCRNQARGLNIHEILKPGDSPEGSFSPSKFPGTAPLKMEISNDNLEETVSASNSPQQHNISCTSPSDFSLSSSIGVAWHELETVDKFISSTLETNGLMYICNRSTDILREMERLETFLIIASSLPPA